VENERRSNRTAVCVFGAPRSGFVPVGYTKVRSKRPARNHPDEKSPYPANPDARADLSQ